MGEGLDVGDEIRPFNSAICAGWKGFQCHERKHKGCDSAKEVKYWEQGHRRNKQNRKRYGQNLGGVSGCY